MAKLRPTIQQRIHVLELLKQGNTIETAISELKKLPEHGHLIPEVIRKAYFPTASDADHQLHVISHLVKKPGDSNEKIDTRIAELTKLSTIFNTRKERPLGDSQLPVLHAKRPLPVKERIRALELMLEHGSVNAAFEIIAAGYHASVRDRVKQFYFPTEKQATNALHVITNLEGKPEEIRKRIKQLQKLER